MADKYLLHRRLDDPELIGLWTLDEFIGLAVPFAWGILSQHILIGMMAAALTWWALRKAKSGRAAHWVIHAAYWYLGSGFVRLKVTPPSHCRLLAGWKGLRMLADIAHQRGQSLLKQRKALLLALAASFLANLALVSALSSKDREIILQPVAARPLTLSSAGVEPDYLELVTRDVALMLLNRSPAGLDYWMEQILKIAHPSAHGRLRAELIRIVTEQRGSDLSQAFVLTGMTVDPKGLTSEVEGDLKTFVGGQVIASERKRFRFGWHYAGLRLSLTSFALVPDPKAAGS